MYKNLSHFEDLCVFSPFFCHIFHEKYFASFFSWWGFHGAFLEHTGKDEKMKTPPKSYEGKIDKFPSTKLTITPPNQVPPNFHPPVLKPSSNDGTFCSLFIIFQLPTSHRGNEEKDGLGREMKENNNVSDSSFSLHSLYWTAEQRRRGSFGFTTVGFQLLLWLHKATQ